MRLNESNYNILPTTIRRKSRTLPLHYFYQRRVDIIDQVEMWTP